jgi:hypothetical protein
VLELSAQLSYILETLFEFFMHVPSIAKSLLLIKLDMILDVLGDHGDSFNVIGNYSCVLKKKKEKFVMLC